MNGSFLFAHALVVGVCLVNRQRFAYRVVGDDMFSLFELGKVVTLSQEFVSWRGYRTPGGGGGVSLSCQGGGWFIEGFLSAAFCQTCTQCGAQCAQQHNIAWRWCGAYHGDPCYCDGSHPCATSVHPFPGVQAGGVSVDLARLHKVLQHIACRTPDLRGTVMFYEPFPGLDSSRLNAEDRAIIEGLGAVSPSTDYVTVLKAALYLGIGGVDEAHNLVTPLSWGAFTEFGGFPVFGSVARQDASYVHALVHRAEGWNIGEFGGAGYSNSGYWWSMTGQHPVWHLWPSVPALLCALRVAPGSCCTD